MADKVSTIRFKTEGIQETASRIDDLTKAITRQQRELGQSMKVAAQGGPNGADAIQLVKQHADQLSRLQQMRTKEQEALFSQEGNLYRQDIRRKADQEEADRTKSAAKIESNAKVREQMDEQAARKAAAAKTVADDRAWQNYMRAEAAANAKEIADSARVASEKASKIEMNAKLREQMDERAAQRQAEMNERAYQKYLAREEASQSASGAGRGMGLSGFGGKMILGMTAGRVAGDVLGDRHGGQEVGSIVSAAMFGGPEMAAAVAGMEVIGSTTRAIREQAKDLVDTQKKYAQEVQKSAEWMQKLANGYVATTKAGAAFYGQIGSETKAMNDAKDAHRKDIGDQGIFGDVAAISGEFWSGRGNSSLDKKTQADIVAYKQHRDRLQRFKGYTAEEQKVARDEAQYSSEQAIKHARISAEYTDSPLLRQKNLAIQQGGEFHKYREETKEGNRQFEHQRNELLHADKVDLSALRALDQEQKEYDKDRAAGGVALEQKHGFQVAQQDRDFARQRAQEKMNADEARINATETGYQKEVDLLKLKHQKETADAVAAHRSQHTMDQLAQQQKDEVAALGFTRDQAVTESHLRMAEQYKVARHQMTSADAEWADRERADIKAGDSPAKIKQERQDFYSLIAADRSQKLQDQEWENKAQRAMLNGADQESVRAQIYMLEHTKEGVTKEQAQGLVKSQMDLEAGQYAHEQVRALHPEVEFKKYQKIMDRAVNLGDVSKADENYLLKQRARESLGGNNGGEFTNAESYWQKVQSSIMQNNDLPKQTLEEIKNLKKELQKLNGDGLKLSA